MSTVCQDMSPQTGKTASTRCVHETLIIFFFFFSKQWAFWRALAIPRNAHFLKNGTLVFDLDLAR